MSEEVQRGAKIKLTPKSSAVTERDILSNSSLGGSTLILIYHSWRVVLLLQIWINPFIIIEKVHLDDLNVYLDTLDT